MTSIRTHLVCSLRSQFYPCASAEWRLEPGASRIRWRAGALHCPGLRRKLWRSAPQQEPTRLCTNSIAITGGTTGISDTGTLTVTNTSTGTISGTSLGIDAAIANVTNSGTIQGTGTSIQGSGGGASTVTNNVGGIITGGAARRHLRQRPRQCHQCRPDRRSRQRDWQYYRRHGEQYRPDTRVAPATQSAASATWM